MRLEITTQTPSELCPAQGLPQQRYGPLPSHRAAAKDGPGGVYPVLYGPKTPSALNLPQLPFKVFPEVRSGPLPTPWSEGNRRH